MSCANSATSDDSQTPIIKRPFDAIVGRLSAPVDAASRVVFRVSFVLISAWLAIYDLRRGRVTEIYVDPQLHFWYGPFDWVRPWPGVGPYFHFIVMAASAACIAA